jgi:tetratricopeptide (TPR) repeat protein
VPKSLSWDKFPQAAAITVFARALGCARSGDAPQARAGIERLSAMKEALVNAKQPFWADQVAVQIEIAKAWTAYATGDARAGLEEMQQAADHEDATDKHPVTPGPLAPARELYGEMLLLSGQPAAALFEFQRSQEKEPNRLRGYYGAAQAAERAGREEIARANYEKLSALTQQADSARPEVVRARESAGGPQASPSR